MDKEGRYHTMEQRQTSFLTDPVMPLASYPSGGETISFGFSSFAKPKSKTFASPTVQAGNRRRLSAKWEKDPANIPTMDTFSRETAKESSPRTSKPILSGFKSRYMMLFRLQLSRNVSGANRSNNDERHYRATIMHFHA